MKIEKITIGNIKAEKISYKSENFEFECLTYGATIIKISSKDKDGNLGNNILAYKDYNNFANNELYLNSVIAPTPGRVEGAKVILNDKEIFLDKNDGDNCLHSGIDSSSSKLFEIVENENNFVTLKTVLSNPLSASVTMFVTYRIKKTKLAIEYSAVSQEDTLFTCTNHLYVNLGNENIRNLDLRIDADTFLGLNDKFIPSHFLNVLDTGFDFQTLTNIGENLDINTQDKQLKLALGIDHPYILKKDEFLELCNNENGKYLKMKTDMESCVVYTANFVNDTYEFTNGKGHEKNGICFETQAIPNGMNNYMSNSYFLKKGQKFTSETIYEFGVETC